MGQILKDIYTDVTVGPLLGFKGGTCAYFFYSLPRFSVDLDFDLLSVNEDSRKNEADQKLIYEKIFNILGKYGQIKDRRIKRFTIFALLSYGDEDHNIKVEINVRQLAENIQDHYELKEYLGISMFVAKPGYLFASKLAALTLRSEVAMRDIYDIHYFAKNNWDINAEIIKARTGKTIKEYLTDCLAFIGEVKNNQILRGLGELVDGEKEKAWIKNYLKADTIFMLKNYLSALK